MPTDQDNTPNIARVCHEAIRAYCVTLGDLSHRSWNEAPDWQRASSIAGARFLCQHPDAGPEACHENWLIDKAADGWVWGEAKNEIDKTHPCIVPYGELLPAQRMKDKIFHAIVRAMA